MTGMRCEEHKTLAGHAPQVVAWAAHKMCRRTCERLARPFNASIIMDDAGQNLRFCTRFVPGHLAREHEQHLLRRRKPARMGHREKIAIVALQAEIKRFERRLSHKWPENTRVRSSIG